MAQSHRYAPPPRTESQRRSRAERVQVLGNRGILDAKAPAVLPTLEKLVSSPSRRVRENLTYHNSRPARARPGGASDRPCDDATILIRGSPTNAINSFGQILNHIPTKPPEGPVRSARPRPLKRYGMRLQDSSPKHHGRQLRGLSRGRVDAALHERRVPNDGAPPDGCPSTSPDTTGNSTQSILAQRHARASSDCCRRDGARVGAAHAGAAPRPGRRASASQTTGPDPALVSVLRSALTQEQDLQTPASGDAWYHASRDPRAAKRAPRGHRLDRISTKIDPQLVVPMYARAPREADRHIVAFGAANLAEKGIDAIRVLDDRRDPLGSASPSRIIDASSRLMLDDEFVRNSFSRSGVNLGVRSALCGALAELEKGRGSTR